MAVPESSTELLLLVGGICLGLRTKRANAREQ
jgi:hypothetical protein